VGRHWLDWRRRHRARDAGIALVSSVRRWHAGCAAGLERLGHPAEVGGEPGRALGRPAWTWARPAGGAGVALWLKADDAQALHDKLAAAGVRIVTDPADGPFGRQFAFADPEGYLITVHDLA
jgi:hypothetical protein